MEAFVSSIGSVKTEDSGQPDPWIIVVDSLNLPIKCFFNCWIWKYFHLQAKKQNKEE